MITRAAYRSKVPLTEESVEDELKEVLNKENDNEPVEHTDANK